MKRGFVWILLVLMISPLAAQGYEIEVSANGMGHDTVILGEYFTTRMIPKDTIVLDSKGKGVFRGPVKFKGGLYLIYFNQNKYFDFLLDSDQVMAIQVDTSDLINKIIFKGSQDNDLFFEYKKLLQSSREKADQLKKDMAAARTAADSSKARSAMDALDQDMEDYYGNLTKNYPDLFVTTFLSATRDPVAPDSILTGTLRDKDSIRYMYFRDHFLDHFDVSDVRLLHTPLYDNKIKTYITRVVPQHPDSLKLAVDFLIGKSRSDEELFRYMLITLFNHFAESKYMGMDAVYFHIAEKYYIPEASWSSKDFIDKLKENLEANKPTLIGEIAPNIELRLVPPEHFQMAALDTAIKRDPHIGENFMLHDIQAKFIILYFWEADCGHCKKSTPELHDVYQRLKDKNVQVIAVHVINTVEGKEVWTDFVNDHEMYDWINCWSPYSNDFRKVYNLQSFPQLFILDESKKIIAKKVTPEQAEDIINTFIKLEN